MASNTYRQQTAEPVTLLPKVLRTFPQYLYELGFRDCGMYQVRDVSWCNVNERLAYLAGRTDALQHLRAWEHR